MPAGTPQGIREQLNGIERTLGGIQASQARADEDRQEIGSAIRRLREDMSDVLALGAAVREMQASIEANRKAIAAIEAWRQRKIGASALLHAVTAIIGSLVGGGITII